jgi:hypothetical protein
MSIDLRISDKPYIADILFKDGTCRRIDYARLAHGGGFFQFLSDEKGEGPVIFINIDIVASIECDNAAQTMGGRQ